MKNTSKAKETTTTTSTIAQNSSEIVDTYKQGVLKVTEEVSKFQPQYAQSISNLQQEYIQLTKEFVNKVFAAQRNWASSNNVTSTTNTTFPSSPYTPYATYAPYAEQFRRQSNEIT